MRPNSLAAISLLTLTLASSLLTLPTPARAMAHSGRWIDLGAGWRFRVDLPHNGVDTGKWHVHVEEGTREKGAEGVDGSVSHGQTLGDCPKWVQEKIRSHPEYEKGKKKQEAADQAIQQAKPKIEAKKLDLSNDADLAIAIGLVIAASATFILPADDVVAWGNLLRAARAY